MAAAVAGHARAGSSAAAVRPAMVGAGTGRRTGCAVTQVTGGLLTVDQVVEWMREIGAALPEADGVAVFNRMYLTVTELVREQLAAAYFDDPAAVTTLDALFAARYLAAVDAAAAGRRPPACWRPLFELRGHPGIHPLQFALAGRKIH